MNRAPTGGGTTMEQANLVHPSAFCWNPHCTDYGKVDHGNISRFGRTQAGTQRYQCRTCSGTFWRGITIESDSRLRVGRAMAKTEEEVAAALMAQLKSRGHPDTPPPMATDGKGGYRDALVETWGQVPEYGGQGRPPTRKQAQPDWHYLQVIKHRCGYRLTGVTIKVVYGIAEEVCAMV